MASGLAILAASGQTLLARLLEQPHTGVILRTLVILALGGAGLYLMLPRGQMPGTRFGRLLGGVLATVALVLFVTFPVSGGIVGLEGTQNILLWHLTDQPDVACYTFHALAFLSVASAGMMITSRNPVYSALWFAMVLLGNSGLFLIQRAEFLSAATVIVYAGAIVVTFLFVIMLAQPQGTAKYDRLTREPLLSCLTGVILAAALVGTLHFAARAEDHGAPQDTRATTRPEETIIHNAARGTSAHGLNDPKDSHVAPLGKTLFVDHVVSVEVIGLLLLAAVAGAVLIAGHKVGEGHKD